MHTKTLSLPYQWHGHGRPLLLVSGLGSRGTSWQPFLSHAAQNWRVLSFDAPGSGNGPPLAGRVEVREMAEQVLGLLDQLGLESVPLVGRSLGGMLAQELALLAPERVSRLVLVSTTGRSDAHLREVFSLWARMAELGIPAQIRHRSSLLWCLGRQALEHDDRVRSYLAARSGADRPRDYALQAHAAARHDALDRLRELRVPTLVVSGSDDRLTPPTHAETLAKTIPGARLMTIPGAGHLPYLETPRSFAEGVLAFLSETEIETP